MPNLKSEKSLPYSAPPRGSAERDPDAADLKLAFPAWQPGEQEAARSSLVMHNVVVAGHRTSVRIEPAIWEALKGIARQQGVTLHELVSDIDRARPASSLSSAIRAFVVIQLSAGLRAAQSASRSQDD